MSNTLSAYVAKVAQKPYSDETKDDHGLHEFMKGRKHVLVQWKYDGIRVFLFSGDPHDSYPGTTGEKVVLVSRHNGVYQASDYPDIFKDMVVPSRTILDGELLGNYVYFFDALVVNGTDIRSKPLANRLLSLSSAFLHREDEHVGIAPTFPAYNEAEVFELYEKAMGLGYEGVVVKDPRAPYGTTNTWLKMKRFVTEDLFVVSGKETPSYRATGVYNSWHLGAYDRNGNLVYVVDASSTTSSVDRRLIKPGVVVEVRHQPTTGFRSLRHPVIIRIRTDKTPDECVLKP